MRSTEEIKALESALQKLEALYATFDYVRIRLASPTRIRSWCERKLPNGDLVGEVIAGETIQFRSYAPYSSGLFSQKIFGPMKDWTCECGKYKGGVGSTHLVCDICGVQLTESRVRRYRMGYINLSFPITHIWYSHGIPNYLAMFLRCYDEKIRLKDIEEVIYFHQLEYFIRRTNRLYPFSRRSKTELHKFLINSLPPRQRGTLERDLARRIPTILLRNHYRLPFGDLRKRKGSEIIQAALEAIDLHEEINHLRKGLKGRSFQETKKRRHLPQSVLLRYRRLRLYESFLSTKTKPEWMILRVLPILPPTLRPFVELENGRVVSADLNALYRIIIERNNRLVELLYIQESLNLIVVQALRLLQEGIDALIDNARLPKEKSFVANDKPLKSLTEILEGKQGRFRNSLLGKRVDYSGRSVIVPGPPLRLNECGLPYEMAKELFRPFLVNQLVLLLNDEDSCDPKTAQHIIQKNKPIIWLLLEQLTYKYCILLNRAPTLHRFGIQAFTPVLVLGQAIQLHPLVCTGFNADFDGDQMAVHLPLYEASQLEIQTMMRPSSNVVSPANGEVVLKPTQDMVIGCYYLTRMIKDKQHSFRSWFPNQEKALLAFSEKKISIHTPIFVRYVLGKNQIVLNKNTIQLQSYGNLILESHVKLIKSFKSKREVDQFYFLTTIGIFIVRKITSNSYEIEDFFLETTAGRLIFMKTYSHVITEKKIL